MKEFDLKPSKIVSDIKNDISLAKEQIDLVEIQMGEANAWSYIRRHGYLGLSKFYYDHLKEFDKRKQQEPGKTDFKIWYDIIDQVDKRDKEDPAMNGGIDLNLQHLIIQNQSADPAVLTPAQMEPYEYMDGLVVHILSINPVTSIPNIRYVR